MDAPTPPTPPGPGVDHAPFYVEVLNDFVAMAQQLAHDLVRQSKCRTDALEAGREHVPPDPSTGFERLGRSVRRSIMLADRLGKPAPGACAKDRIAARKRIIRAVADAIESNADPGEAESLEAEFLERLDSPEFEDDLDGRPVAEIIAEIARDLGLAAMSGTRPWKRRTPADIAELCARAARPCMSAAGAARAGGARAGTGGAHRAPPGPARAEAGAGAEGRAGTSRTDPGRADPGWADPDAPDPDAPDPDAPGPTGRPAQRQMPGGRGSFPPEATPTAATRPLPDPARPAGIPAGRPPPAGAGAAGPSHPDPIRYGAPRSQGPPWHLGR